MLKFISGTLAAVLLFFTCAASAEQLVQDPIYSAYTQQYLIQRSAKKWLMIGADIDEQSPLHLEKTIQLFEQNLIFLGATLKSAEQLKQLITIKAIWADYHPLLLQTPSPEKASALLSINESLYDACLALTRMMASANNNHDISHTANQPAILSQKIAKLYVALYWHVDHPSLKDDIMVSSAEFEEVLTILLKYPANSPDIQSRLKKINNLWRFEKKLFTNLNSKEYAPTVVTKYADSITKKTIKVSQLYHSKLH